MYCKINEKKPRKIRYKEYKKPAYEKSEAALREDVDDYIYENTLPRHSER